MIIKPTEYKGMNMEYRIWNIGYWIQFIQNSKFCSRYSKFNILRSTRRGFTLIETLVAIGILLTAVVGPISLIGDALHKLYYAKDQMIAINLAQEGIEVVRQVRDSRMLGDSGVDIFSLPSPTYYIVDAGSLAPSVDSDMKPVLISSDGFYKQAGAGTQTQFTRLVTIEIVGTAGTERKVTSNVEWMTGGQAGSITATEHLFRWAI